MNKISGHTFQYPCFLRLNNTDVLKQLEELGYRIWTVEPEHDMIVCSEFNFYAQSAMCPDQLEPIITTDMSDNSGSYTEHGYIDCGDNVQLFLAIAALRVDDNHMNQWFVLNDDVTTPDYNCDKFVKCESKDWEFDFWSWNQDDDLQPDDFHKATLEELLEHFNND